MRQQPFPAGAARLVLSSEERYLFGTERTIPQVGHQAVGAAGDVADVKPDRAEAVRGGPDLGATQAFGVPGEVLTGLLEGIEERGKEGMHTLERPSQPGFRNRFDRQRHKPNIGRRRAISTGMSS